MKITEKMIDSCFEQEDYVTALYVLAFPDWDAIKEVNGWPKVDRDTSEYIWDKIKEDLDGASLLSSPWFNHGFGTDDSLPPETLNIEGVEVVYA